VVSFTPREKAPGTHCWVVPRTVPVLLLTEHHAMKAYWGSGFIVPRVFTSALGGGEWSASRPGHSTPEVRVPGTHWLDG
jgi:hypothetical protein